MKEWFLKKLHQLTGCYHLMAEIELLRSDIQDLKYDIENQSENIISVIDKLQVISCTFNRLLDTDTVKDREKVQEQAERISKNLDKIDKQLLLFKGIVELARANRL